jgi:hypothetical protein
MGVSCKALQPIVKTSGEQNKIEGESFVLAAERPSNFLYSSIVKGSVTVRNTYLPFDSGAIIYAEDEDYTIDYNNGTIARTAGSRIPDYAKYNLFEKKDHLEAMMRSRGVKVNLRNNIGFISSIRRELEDNQKYKETKIKIMNLF